MFSQDPPVAGAADGECATGARRPSLTSCGQELFEIGLYVAKADGSGYRVINIEPGQLLSQAAFDAAKEVWCTVELADTSVPLVVIPSTARPEQECEFRLRFESSEPVTVAPVDPELQYRMYTQAGKWEGASAGGCKNYPATVCNNPQYSLELEKATTVTVTLSQTLKDPFAPIGIYVCKSRGESCEKRIVICSFPSLCSGIQDLGHDGRAGTGPVASGTAQERRIAQRGTKGGASQVHFVQADCDQVRVSVVQGGQRVLQGELEPGMLGARFHAVSHRQCRNTCTPLCRAPLSPGTSRPSR